MMGEVCTLVLFIVHCKSMGRKLFALNCDNTLYVHIGDKS